MLCETGYLWPQDSAVSTGLDFTSEPLQLNPNNNKTMSLVGEINIKKTDEEEKQKEEGLREGEIETEIRSD